VADISPISYDLATLRGHQFLEAAVSQWGNRGTGADATSDGLLIGDGRASIVGAAVHPRSTVEGFRIRWAQGSEAESGLSTANPAFVRRNDYIVMRDKPFVGRLLGAFTIVPLPQDYYADAYRLADGVTTPLFGGLMVAPEQFTFPECWAMLWLRNEPRDAGARHSLRVLPVTRILTGFGTVDTVGAFPTAGRKTIKIVMNSVAIPSSPGSAAAPINVAVNGISGNNISGAGNNNLQEYGIQSVHIPAGTNATLEIPGPHQWIILKAEVEDATPAALLWSVDGRDYI
jgi:hypothetical protein